MAVDVFKALLIFIGTNTHRSSFIEAGRERTEGD